MESKIQEHGLEKLRKLSRVILEHRIFKFLISGVISAGVDLTVFSIFYNLVFFKQTVNLYGWVLNPYSAALIISYSCGAVTSFSINKFFVFSDSRSWKMQLLRFVPVNLLAFAANFVLLKFFVEFLHFWPTVGRAGSAILVAFVTFNLHKHFTFQTKN